MFFSLCLEDRKLAVYTYTIRTGSSKAASSVRARFSGSPAAWQPEVRVSLNYRDTEENCIISIIILNDSTYTCIIEHRRENREYSLSRACTMQPHTRIPSCIHLCENAFHLS